ncbi:hypothetical protein AYO51_13875 [Lactiplantibacillus plantarum]|uniref:hypothetical protein n=1 Tax=Lactiplantibacillus plantarum TaxID=1590 RepID=UPI000787B361|nr:hypothetical protein [Lactiplantibacillus plantarum]KYK51786.1 hypothetical protein AYO51_13875 [Lactiplantibacillus plantarum]KYM69286.1 hypothetical protein AZJ01_02420 [Lactiplantibacillus plantarum]
MSKTMKQLTMEFGVTRQAIMRKMDDKFRNKYVSKVHSNGVSKLTISDDGYKLLKQHFLSGNRVVSNESVSYSNYVPYDSVTDTAMELLEKQLVEKDKQIEKLQQSLSEAHKLLDQQQQLNLSTNRQNEKLLDTTTPSQDDSPLQSDDTDVLKPTDGNSKGVENKTPKKGLFGWLRR